MLLRAVGELVAVPGIDPGRFARALRLLRVGVEYDFGQRVRSLPFRRDLRAELDGSVRELRRVEREDELPDLRAAVNSTVTAFSWKATTPALKTDETRWYGITSQRAIGRPAKSAPAARNDRRSKGYFID